MARIAIIGPGAVGGATAAHLTHTGRHDVVLCARRAFDALTVETGAGTLSSRPTIWTSPDEATAVDWVIITTKTYDAAGAARWLPRLTAAGAQVAVMQNGVEHRERFAPYLDPARIVPVIVDLPAERDAPGKIRQRGQSLMTVASDGPGKAFAALFTGTGITVNVVEDFASAAWRKLCLNAAGVLNALLLKPAGVMHDDLVAEAARTLVRECMAVARAEGAVLEDDLPDRIVAGYRAAPRDGVNSLHADRAAGRPLELDARNGVIVRLGRTHGIPTPANQLVVALLSSLSSSTS